DLSACSLQRSRLWTSREPHPAVVCEIRRSLAAGTATGDTNWHSMGSAHRRAGPRRWTWERQRRCATANDRGEESAGQFDDLRPGLQSNLRDAARYLEPRWRCLRQSEGSAAARDYGRAANPMERRGRRADDLFRPRAVL